jgi:hypothetical protein
MERTLNQEAPPDQREASASPTIGTLVKDSRGRVGKVMAVGSSMAFLRPVGGGLEWEARIDTLVPVTASEQLSPRIAEANARSSWDVR